MATDAEKRKIWEQQIESTLNSRREGKSKYTLLRSNQLVGAALIIFAKSSIVNEIRNVETAIKKVIIVFLNKEIKIFTGNRRLLWVSLVIKVR